MAALISSRFNYGWVVVAACFLAAATMGETFASSGVFFKPLVDEFGWSRAVASSAFTVFLLGYSAAVFVSGRLADRHSPRLILLATAFLAGGGLALNSLVNSINDYRFFNFIAGLGSGALVTVPIAVVQRWFHGRSGGALALGLVSSGGPVGQLIFPSLMNALIVSHSWRNAYVINGAIFFVLICVASLMIRQSPSKPTRVSGKGATNSAYDQSWATRQAVTSGVYVSILISFVVSAFIWQSLIVHFVPHAIDSGMSSTVAAVAFGLLGGMSIIGRLGVGFVADKVGWQKGNALSYFGMAAALILLVVPVSTLTLYSFVIVFGIVNGLRVASQWGLLSDFFGLSSLGELIGITAGIAGILSAIGPYLAGAVFDATGSYRIDFALFIVLALGAGLTVWMMRKPVPPALELVGPAPLTEGTAHGDNFTRSTRLG